MIEGEEEIGSKVWAGLEQTKKKTKTCDLISDTGMISNQQPSITTGLRGLSYVEVELQVQTATLFGLYKVPFINQSMFGKMITSLHDETTTLPFRFLW
jgi:acetylornithine deacetylase/succinyl-diaminopimelate desuccinylase-like protein